jgi:hypothetical protein
LWLNLSGSNKGGGCSNILDPLDILSYIVPPDNSFYLTTTLNLQLSHQPYQVVRDAREPYLQP